MSGRPANRPAPLAAWLLGTLRAASFFAPERAFGFAAPFETESIFSVNPGQIGLRMVTTYEHQQDDVSMNLPKLEGLYRFSENAELDVSVPVELDIESGPHYAFARQPSSSTIASFAAARNPGRLRSGSGRA